MSSPVWPFAPKNTPSFQVVTNLANAPRITLDFHLIASPSSTLLARQSLVGRLAVVPHLATTQQASGTLSTLQPSSKMCFTAASWCGRTTMSPYKHRNSDKNGSGRSITKCPPFCSATSSPTHPGAHLPFGDARPGASWIPRPPQARDLFGAIRLPAGRLVSYGVLPTRTKVHTHRLKPGPPAPGIRAAFH